MFGLKLDTINKSNLHPLKVVDRGSETQFHVGGAIYLRALTVQVTLSQPILDKIPNIGLGTVPRSLKRTSLSVPVHQTLSQRKLV